MQKKLRFEYESPAQFDEFDPVDFVEKFEKFIKEKTSIDRGEKVAISVSGGVDSTTTAFLLREIAGKNLYLFFIDDGLRRRIRGREEYEIAEEIFHDFANFEVVHAKNDFLPTLLDSNLTDGEEKRKKFQEIYTMVSNKRVSDIGASWIADGTIKPDIEETDARIKTQHNVDIVYSAKKIEPLASLYKPHVRKLAKYVGIPDEVVYKVPMEIDPEYLRKMGEEIAKKCKNVGCVGYCLGIKPLQLSNLNNEPRLSF